MTTWYVITEAPEQADITIRDTKQGAKIAAGLICAQAANRWAADITTDPDEG